MYRRVVGARRGDVNRYETTIANSYLASDSQSIDPVPPSLTRHAYKRRSFCLHVLSSQTYNYVFRLTHILTIFRGSSGGNIVALPIVVRQDLSIVSLSLPRLFSAVFTLCALYTCITWIGSAIRISMHSIVLASFVSSNLGEQFSLLPWANWKDYNKKLFAGISRVQNTTYKFLFAR